MSVKYVASLCAAALIGFAISPSYSTELVSCNGFESCPTNDGDAIVALEARIAALEALLADVSRGTDPNTSQDTLTLAGMNVQIVNGTGITESINGTGNLIIGYNDAFPPEPPGPDGCPDGHFCNRRGGSHNLVIGRFNNYSQYGGMVVGLESEIGRFASVIGGYRNTASGDFSSINSGNNNKASGTYSYVSGGHNNTSSGSASSVSGGGSNTASSDASSVSGGYSNTASGAFSAVSGGDANKASNQGSSVSGGVSKDATAMFCWEGAPGVDC